MFLDIKFRLRDLGALKYFLGIEAAKSKKWISICQRHYALKLLSDSGLLGCKPRSTPMDVNKRLSQDEGDLISDPTSYRRLIEECYNSQSLGQTWLITS